MTHDDRAADVLNGWLRDWMSGCSVGDQLDALAAADLAVVRVGEPPPWMERANVWCDSDVDPVTHDVIDAGTENLWVQPDGMDIWIGNQAPAGSVPLYRLTEGNDR